MKALGEMIDMVLDNSNKDIHLEDSLVNQRQPKGTPSERSINDINKKKDHSIAGNLVFSALDGL